MASQSFPRQNLSRSAADAQELVLRYPDISEQELAALIRNFRSLPLLDFGLLAADPKIGRKLDEFYADHGDKLRPALNFVEWLGAATVVAGVFALIYAALG